MPFLTAAGHKLEYEWIEAPDAGKPALVFLHEGLGSIRQWRDFPLRVSRATGCPALVYSRYGYGHSDVLEEPRRSVRFMHEEALEALPAVLAETGIRTPILVGFIKKSPAANYRPFWRPCSILNRKPAPGWRSPIW